MITPIPRTSIFRTSAFADNLVAELQSAYASGFDLTDKAEADMLRQYYDHRQPFRQLDPPISEHAVLALAADSVQHYTAMLPQVLQKFLQLLQVEQLYLLDFLRSDLNTFPFENFRKQNQFKKLAGKHSADVGYVLDMAELPRLLPLFLFSRKYDIPVIFLVTAKGETPLSLHLCDDGNLHISYQTEYQNQVQEAAREAGFELGDHSLCTTYSVSYLRNK